MENKDIKASLSEITKLNLSDHFNTASADMPSDEEFAVFKKKIAPIINLDLTNYKNKQMERRIVSLMTRCNIKNLAEYAEILKKDEKSLDDFLNMLTINVSEFFRNSEKFEEFEKSYMPELLKKPKIKIWSAGCSIGAEVYSLAMIFDKHKALSKCEFVASDFDKKIIQKAQSGIYTATEVGTVPSDYKNYFTKIDEKNNYQIDKKLIASVRFEKRDLLNSKYEKGFDLILCRNVVIYFTEEAKDKLYAQFYESLNPGGLLFIGSTERINNHKQFGYNLRTSFFYQR